MAQFQDKVVIVTGGAKGIGRAISLSFAREGANVLCADVDVAAGEAISQEAAGLAGKLVAQAIAGDAQRFDVFARLKHHNFPGGKLLRLPALVAAMAWYRLRDLLA